MNNKKIITAGAALTAVIAIIGMSVSTYASEGGIFKQKGFMNNKNHEAMQEAMEANDYETWSELAGSVTAENFEKFVEAHELMQSGDREGARVIFKELGIQGPREGSRGIVGKGFNLAVREAIENNDYEAFVEAVGDKPIAGQITAKNFASFVEAHELMWSGDREGARVIFEELGIEGPRRGSKGMMYRFDNNGDGVCDFFDKE